MTMSWLYDAAFVVLVWTATSQALNVTVLVIREHNEEPAAPPTTPHDVTSSSTTFRIVDDVDIFNFWATEYPALSGWLVVLDTRTTSCPLDLFHNNLLGYITLHPGTCGAENDTSVYQVHTTPFDYRDVVVNVANYTHSPSNSVAFLYDESGREYHEQISLRKLNHFLFQLELPLPRDNIPEMLANLTVKTDVRYVFLMGTSVSLGDMLTHAHRLNMLSGRYHWLIYSTDGITPHCIRGHDHTILFIKDLHNTVTMDNERRLMAFTADVIEEMHDVIAATSDPVCDCTSSCESCRSLFNRSLNKVMEGETQVFRQDDGAGSEVKFTLSKYTGNDTTSLSKVATWSESGGVESTDQLFNCGVRGVVLRVAAVVEPPFVFRNSTGDYSGYSIDALEAISKIIGFTYTVKECYDGHYGNMDSNSVWTGCIRNIVDGDSDIIAGALTVTADREDVVDFTLPYYDFAGIQIVMKKQNREVSLFYFADVFTPLAWLCLGVVIAVTSIMLLLFDRYTPTRSKNATVEGVVANDKAFDLKESIWFVMGSLTMSGAGVPPKSFPARLLVAGFWFFSVIMMSTFTANLAAFLTVSRMGSAINSMTELASQSDIKYSVVAESSVMTYFKRMAAIEESFYTIWKDMSMGGGNNSLAVWDYPLGDKYVNIWKNMEDTGLFNSTEQAVSSVLGGGVAFITDSPIIKYLTYRNCDLTAIGDLFSVRPYAFALKEKSVYTKKISSAILELQKKRQLEAFKRRWWDEGKLNCPESSTDQGLDLKSLTGSFIVVAVGILSGLLVLSLEHFWNRVLKRKQSPITQVKPTASSGSKSSLGLPGSGNMQVTVLGATILRDELHSKPDS
ncbi:ionotropic receptor 25a-like [Haliotis rufescens]|uniref:ionotropic receptor 25a-like n=1 Tax=Haliotis rufescens TaxID=6454 RepID=UPI00201F3A1C|nr:ionotropic receptor 25a-like [Haliotis rufescens]